MCFIQTVEVSNMKAYYRTVTRLISEICEVFDEADCNYELATAS